MAVGDAAGRASVMALHKKACTRDIDIKELQCKLGIKR